MKTTKMRFSCSRSIIILVVIWNSKVYGSSVGPSWGWQAPAGPHIGPENLATWMWHKSEITSLDDNSEAASEEEWFLFMMVREVTLWSHYDKDQFPHNLSHKIPHSWQAMGVFCEFKFLPSLLSCCTFSVVFFRAIMGSDCTLFSCKIVIIIFFVDELYFCIFSSLPEQ